MIHHSVDDILADVNAYVRTLNVDGGKFKFEVDKDFKPRAGGSPFRLSASGKCTRQLAYENLKPEQVPVPDVKGLNIFMLGDVVHDFERYLISQVAEYHSIERKLLFKVDDDTWVPGHCDIVVTLTDGTDVPIDVKTASDSSFQRMLKEGPPEDYIYQLNTYLDALDLDLGYIWVYNKNDSSRMLIPVERKQEIVEIVRQKFRTAMDATLDNLPERGYEPGRTKRRGKETGQEYLHFKCVWCPFVEECWGSLGFKPVTTDEGKTRWLREANWLEEFFDEPVN